MKTHEVFEPGDGRKIAYHNLPARGAGVNAPGVVFLGGFKSDMAGTKAIYLEDWARSTGRAFLRFDYTGHGISSGDFLDGCIGEWAQDAYDAITALTNGPQILVGSSMGGWISLLLARRMPERIAGLIGIAAAPDFTENGMWAGFSDAERAALMRDGRVEQPSEYSDDPYVITRKLIEDGRQQLVLDAPLHLPFPVRLLHGTADADVPMDWTLRLLDHATGPDIRAIFVQRADHRMSTDDDLTLLTETVEEVIRRDAAARPS
ncbi:pimeloyl-ACP methyl ester carboxylesterase [Rubricella aquisinus]|uniref:Pimeloyl-ACP methyl ester carboxylesterase n=1 Tax=Rubricella aquisinus TaxID=2028108 RepID=A0A840WSC8_9RHOB|nr:alpha/beta hydrolase [Rubricella aquisinus]MBB5516572.1 pimeloyl-ACP methyl ester carboxylesterase [Rubricella aquisinus]